MKSTQRRAATAAGFLALSLAGSSVVAQQPQMQRGGPPNPDTPQILVTTFLSPDRQLGVQVGDELRKRIQQEHNGKELWAVPKKSIDNTLEASGYRPDSALNASDLMELSKQLHGDYVIEGTATKTATGVNARARLLMRAGVSQTIAQPLPPVDGKDAGDVAKGLEQRISESLKGMAAYKKCTNDVRAAKYPEAIADASVGIQAYPNSSFNRLCVLTALNLQKAAPDTIIAVANAVRNIDPTSMIALGSLADAYMAKGDTTRAIETNLAIYRADPSNTAIAQSIVQTLANSGAPEKAIPIIDSLMVQMPGDPTMLRTKWLLQLRARQYKPALVTGEEYVKADTAAANLDYYQRQIGAAQSDSNAAGVQQFAARASQKFPTDPTFPMLLAQSYIKSGQFPQALLAARRATAIDPKSTNAWLLAIAAANGNNMRDSSSAFAQMAIAAGADKATFATAMLGPTQELLNKAQASKARADWEAMLASAQSVDASAPSPQSKFFVGLASFQVAADLVNTLQEQAKTAQKTSKKADKEAACGTAKQIDDLLTLTSINMPAGASVSKETAGQIMSGSTQLSDFTGQIKKAFACK